MQQDEFPPTWNALRLLCTLMKDSSPLIQGKCISLDLAKTLAHLQMVHQRLTSVSYLSLLATLNLTLTLSDMIVRRLRVESFFTGFCSRGAPRWWSFRPLS